MKLIKIVLSAIALCTCVGGCGDAGQTEVAAEKDEIAKWVEENPAPEEVALEDPLEGE